MKKNTKKIFSIIIPCYNGANTIRRAISSILEQSYNNFEVIIINDASTDDCLEIIKKLVSNDSRFKILNLKKNLGLSGARNSGLQSVRGKYVCFLDADDWWPSKKLEEYLKLFNEGYDLLYSNYTRVNAQTGKKKYIKVIRHIEYKDLLAYNPIPVSSAAFNSETIGIYKFKDILLAEDWVYWLDIFKMKPKSLGINKNYMFYSVSSGTLSSNKLKMACRAWSLFRSYHNFSFLRSIFLLVKYLIAGVRKRI
ncbi:glycosyltransferase [Methylophilaceae bacterium]|nr:glycosyltransferase [Methylophilaceae bacterium]